MRHDSSLLGAIARSLTLVALGGSVLLVAPAAHADAPAVSTANEQTIEKKPLKEPKFLAIEGNPLGLLIGRYSLQVEWVPATHHALVLNPHFDHVSADIGSGNLSYTEAFTGFGTEVGYRFYTGKRGMEGFFIGPSLLLGTYSTSVTAVAGSATGAASTSFTSIGGAVDLGGQAVIGPGVVLGAGFGLQYSSVDKSFADLPLTASILAGGGWRPRFLLSVGYAF
jgi:hypothetical protein